MQINKKDKILICGLGSIGKRHSKNLISLGFKNLIFYKESKKKIDKKFKKYKIFTKLKDALKEKPKISFITNVTSKHIVTAIKCAKTGSHLFIEKPLSNNLKNIKKLENILKKKKLYLMIGYMMRFHPIIQRIKKIIQSNKLGKIFFGRSIWGEHLPDWHPNENYKKSYAAKKKLGGGSCMTLSHDFDLFLWWFGKIRNINIDKVYNSKLKIETDTSSSIQIRFKNDIIVQIHNNFLSKPHIRKIELFGEKGMVEFNYYKNTLKLTSQNNKSNFFTIKKFKRNQMFIEELKYFFNTLKFEKKIESDLKYNVNLIKYLIKK